mgnify:CR=1 FL=1
MVDFTKDNNWVLERKDGLFKKYRRKLLDKKGENNGTNRNNCYNKLLKYIFI